MRFDEVETKVENLVGDLNIPLGVEGTLLDMIDELRQEYAPTVEMTKTDKEMLIYYLENYSFYVFIDTVHTSKGNTFGLPANDDFNELSDEDLMQAWLHPNDIRILDKE